MTFDEIYVLAGEDEAAEWAATREYELRRQRAERAELGLAGMLAKTTQAVKRFNLALTGDPDAPKKKNPKTKLSTEAEWRRLFG